MSDTTMQTPEPDAPRAPALKSDVADRVDETTPAHVAAENAAPEGAPAANEVQEHDPESNGEDKQERPKKPVQERISQLVAQRKDAEARAEMYARDLYETQRQLQQLAARLNDPDTPYEQSDQDRLRYALAEEKQADLQRQAERAAQEAAQRRFETFQTKAQEFAQRNPDFWDSFQNAPVTNEMADLIVESDRAPEIAYRLAKDPALSRKIANMPPHLQGREIARIERELQSAPVVRKTSTAPPPVRTVGGHQPATVKDPATMTDAEYSAWYKQRQSKRA
jgi:hypothetical protein